MEDNSSSCSLENVSTTRQKKGFFRSLRIRGRKISNTESGLGESVSKSSLEKSGKEEHDFIDDTNRSNAQNKRKAFQKAYTTPERMNHSFSRSMDLDSFDYESNQDVYLANYETEMRGDDHGHKNLGQNSLTPSRVQITSAPNPSHSYDSSLYVTAEQITVPSNPGYRQDPNPYYTNSQSSWQPENSQTYKNNSRPQSSTHNDNARATTSLSMTALRPRSSGQMEQPIRQPVTPAFATYTGPISAEDLTTDKPTELKRESTSRHNSFKTDEDVALEVNCRISLFLYLLQHHL